MPEIDLDELAAWAREYAGEVIGRQVYPADLQRLYRLTWNQACSALEALEARGVLERIPGSTLAWKLAAAPPQPGKGYSLPLSQAEHGALLRALEERLTAPWLVVICREGVTEATFFREEAEARSFFDRASAQWSDAFLTQIRTGPRDTCGHLPQGPDRASLRSLRSKLLQKVHP